MASIYEIQSNSTTVDLTAVYSLYAECATAAGTAAKIAKLADANITSLISGTSSAPLKGMHLFVKFTYSNTVASPTLTIQNSAGTTLLAAKSMMQYGTTAIGTNERTSWRANAIVEFVFDGTNWVEAYGTDANDNSTSYASTVDGVTQTSNTINRYAVSDTAAATAAKAANITSGTISSLAAGVVAYVKFTYPNTASSPTLNISSKGAANIYYQGQQITTGNEKYFLRGTCLFVYDGSNWHLIAPDNPPIQSKTFTNVIGTANNWTDATFFYGRVMPTGGYNDLWVIKYRLYIEAAGSDYSKAFADVTISGTQNTYVTYAVYNSIESTSYRPAYHHVLYTCTSTGIANGYGPLIGTRLYSSWNATTAANARTVKIDIISTDHCEFEFFDSAIKYSAAPGTGSTNYYTYYELTFTNSGLYETGDSDTIIRLQYYNQYLTTGSNIRLGGYSLLGFDRNDIIQPISLYNATYSDSTTSISTSRVYNTAGFDWTRGLYYYNSSVNRATNYSFVPPLFVADYAIDLRYSDNCAANTGTTNYTLGMVLSKPVYFRGIIKEDGLFYLQPMEVTYSGSTYKRVWTQDIPTTEETVTIDGHTYQYVYWFIGEPYYDSSYSSNLYRLNLHVENKMYWWHNSRVEEYTQGLANKMPIVSFGEPEVVVDTTTLSFAKDGEQDWYITAENPISGFTPSSFNHNYVYDVQWDGVWYTNLQFRSADVVVLKDSWTAYTSAPTSSYEFGYIGNIHTLCNFFRKTSDLTEFPKEYVSYGYDTATDFESTLPFCIEYNYYKNSDEVQIISFDTASSHTIKITRTYVDVTILDQNFYTDTLRGVQLIRKGSGDASIILGYAPAKVSGNHSFAMGSGIVTGNWSFSEGSLSLLSGNNSHVEGSVNNVSGNNSHAEGLANTVSGNYSHAEGYINTASGNRSHAEGSNNKAQGMGSHAEGGLTTASGDYSHAEGNNNTASGTDSHVEGTSNTSSGEYSHAEGVNTTASGVAAHAEGGDATASGNCSHAEGCETTASGYYAHAEGATTTASGDFSHAEGYHTTAQRQSQHVFGEYNVLDVSGTTTTRGTYVEIVGNGAKVSGVENRSNARTLDWSGNEVLAGKLTLGANPTANMDAVTKQYMESKGYVTSSGVTSITITATSPIAVDSSAAITSTGTRTISHANSGATAGGYGPTANATLNYSGTFTVPQFTINATGHVTSATPRVYTLPASDNTDTKQNVTLATISKAFVTGVTTTPTGTAQALTGVADTGVYLTTTAGQLNATTYKVNEAVTMQYNSTSKSLDFIFA